uniref:C2H2-type domain-containing protein n=1 Tax=Nothobranchius furzeri TaxID=105023 RepID=A0A8C6Q0Y1_NOTFU
MTRCSLSQFGNYLHTCALEALRHTSSKCTLLKAEFWDWAQECKGRVVNFTLENQDTLGASEESLYVKTPAETPLRRNPRGSVTVRRGPKGFRVKSKPFDCRTCGKMFRRSDKLLLHTRTARSRTFVTSVHLSSHSDDKPHTCGTCCQNFKYTDTLKIHMRIHTGERPYVCSLCGNKFVNASKLNLHKKTHTDEKPHVCDTCGKRFIRLHGLKGHMKTHTGEKVYACVACGEGFGSVCSLNRHTKAHAGETSLYYDWLFHLAANRLSLLRADCPSATSRKLFWGVL